MSQHLENAFNDVVMRDMMTNDEEGMFFLFCWEQGMHGFSEAMGEILMDELIHEIGSLFGVNQSNSAFGRSPK